MRRNKYNATFIYNNITYDYNNLCPFKFKCWESTYELKCFGHFKSCKRYKTGDLSLKVSTFEDWEKGKF